MPTNKLEDDGLHYARTLARLATVERSFVVYPESPSDEDLGCSADSFKDAYDSLAKGQARSLAVVFDWKLGVTSGIGATVYSTPAGFTPSEIFVEQYLSNAVTETIARHLRNEHSKRKHMCAAA